MTDQGRHEIEVVVLDERTRLSLGELARCSGVSADYVTDMVAEGLIEPTRGETPAEWRFDALALWRAQTAAHLQRDLEVNLAGAALALELLEELRNLRRRMNRLEGLFESW